MICETANPLSGTTCPNEALPLLQWSPGWIDAVRGPKHLCRECAQRKGQFLEGEEAITVFRACEFLDRETEYARYQAWAQRLQIQGLHVAIDPLNDWFLAVVDGRLYVATPTHLMRARTNDRSIELWNVITKTVENRLSAGANQLLS